MTDETEGKVQDQTTDTQDTGEANEVEVQARKMGWRPIEEWEGNQDNWMPAEDFVKRQERLRSVADPKLKSEIAGLKRQVESLQRTLEDAKEHLTKADKRALEKARKEVQAEADRAAEEGDTAAYKAARSKMHDLETEAQTTAQEGKAQQFNPDEDPNFQAWLPENAWYDPTEDGFDPEMAAFADQIAPAVGRTGLTGKAFYDRISSEVKKRFPDKFGNPNRKKASAVEGGSPKQGGNGSTKWSQVPKDDQAAFHRFVKQGLYKDTKEDREKYADIYLNG